MLVGGLVNCYIEGMKREMKWEILDTRVRLYISGPHYSLEPRVTEVTLNFDEALEMSEYLVKHLPEEMRKARERRILELEAELRTLREQT